MSTPVEIPPFLLKLLRAARHLVVFTGAGMSAESGVPTFRDAQTGLWAQYDPAELATPEAFRQHPKRVWDWYAWRRELVARARPNPGHRAVAEMERYVPQVTVVTQNVDGLHQDAGSSRVIELHGNLRRIVCSRCRREVPREQWAPAGPEGVPRCPHCGGLLRPDVVWFGEPLPGDAWRAAQQAMRTADGVLVVGTSGLVYPAAGLPLEAKAQGAWTMEVNPTPSALSAEMDYVLRGPAGEVLPALVRAAWGDAAGS